MTKPKAKGKKPRAKKKRAAPAQPQLLIEGPARLDDGPPKAKRRVFDDTYLEDMCAYIGEGESLRSWAALTGHLHNHVIRWIQADAERNRLYREARKMQADALMDQLIELSDEKVAIDAFGRMDSAAVQDKRVRLATRQFIASKFHPGMYGDKVSIDATVDVSNRKPDEVMAMMVALLAGHGLCITPVSDASDGSIAAG